MDVYVLWLYIIPMLLVILAKAEAADDSKTDFSGYDYVMIFTPVLNLLVVMISLVMIASVLADNLKCFLRR